MIKSSFFQSTKIAIVGMAIAQAIPLLGSLLIARLYSPGEFGAFATWLGVVMTAAVLITGRLEMTLVIEDEGESRTLALIAVLLTICSGSVLLFLMIGASFFIPVSNPLTSGLTLIVLPATLLAAVIQTWQSWAAAEGNYYNLSYIRIAQAIGVTGTQIFVGFFFPSALGLAIGHCIGLLIGIGIAIYMMPIRKNRIRNNLPFVPELKNFWIKHKNFPLYALPADFINTAAGYIPLIFIASKFGADASGLYALTIRILGGPISLLGTAILDVFKKTAATSFRNLGNCRNDYVRTFIALALLGAIFSGGVMLFGEFLFAWAFGEPWRQSGVIAIWLLPMFALRFVASPLSYVFYIVGAQKVDLVWQCCLLLVTISSFMVAENFESAIKLYAIGYAFLYVIYLMLSYHYSKGTYK